MRLVVLISGRGSNLKSLIDNLKEAEFLAVISNNPNAQGLNYADEVNAKKIIINHKGFLSRQEFDAKLSSTIKNLKPDLIVLAGFMLVLGSEFVHQFDHRIVNIHPSLLPKYKGVNTHQRALESRDKFHGATVHWVTEVLDGGEIILQEKVPILPNDTKDILAMRVLKVEHQLYPKAIRKILPL